MLSEHTSSLSTNNHEKKHSAPTTTVCLYAKYAKSEDSVFKYHMLYRSNTFLIEQEV